MQQHLITVIMNGIARRAPPGERDRPSGRRTGERDRLADAARCPDRRGGHRTGEWDRPGGRRLVPGSDPADAARMNGTGLAGGTGCGTALEAGEDRAEPV